MNYSPFYLLCKENSSADFGARELAPSVYDGSYMKINLIKKIPPVDYVNFSNLDEIVNLLHSHIQIINYE